MAAPDRVFEAEEILRTLAENRVDFVVIGGIAVQAHGYIRSTKDLDVVVRPTAVNLSRLSEALGDLEAEPQAGGATLTKLGPIRVIDLENLAGRPASYDSLRDAALVIDLNEIEVPVAGLSDLIRMKRAAGREHDLADIEALTRDAEST